MQYLKLRRASQPEWFTYPCYPCSGQWHGVGLRILWARWVMTFAVSSISIRSMATPITMMMVTIVVKMLLVAIVTKAGVVAIIAIVTTSIILVPLTQGECLRFAVEGGVYRWAVPFLVIHAVIFHLVHHGRKQLLHQFYPVPILFYRTD